MNSAAVATITVVTRRDRLTRLCLILLSVFLTVTAAEIFLRQIDYDYTPLRIKVVNNYSEWRYYHSFQDQHFVYDPYLIWRPKKGAFVFNSQGYRGKEISIEKKPGEFRIFAIGDSNTLGWFGDDGPNWPMYLQELINNKHSTATVVNAGVYGYSSFQGLRRFNETLQFGPDMVLISFGGNDAMRVTEPDKDYDKTKIRSLGLDKSLNQFKLGQLFLALGDKAFLRESPRLVPRVDVAEFKYNLTEIIRRSKERNTKVVLLTRPFIGPSPNESWWKHFAADYNAATREIAKSNGVTMIDVYSYFENDQRYFLDESHFNKEGHRLMAQIIYDKIISLINLPSA